MKRVSSAALRTWLPGIALAGCLFVMAASTVFFFRAMRTGSSSTATPLPHFRVAGSGQLERSTQPGIWMPIAVAPDVHFRVVSVSGADAWAGADRLRLFHSADRGLTWTEIGLPPGADRTHPIVRIRIDSPRKLTVEDGAGASWTTNDGGASWQ